ncbi:MAG: sigma-70 domain-containing protein [Polyangiaceae bacterium]
MRPALTLVLHALLEETRAPGARLLSLDRVAEAIGTVAVSADEVEVLVSALEAEGRTVVDADDVRSPKDDLALVLPAARALSKELGRKPTVAELAERTGISAEAVGRALRFAEVMAR